MSFAMIARRLGTLAGHAANIADAPLSLLAGLGQVFAAFLALHAAWNLVHVVHGSRQTVALIEIVLFGLLVIYVLDRPRRALIARRRRKSHMPPPWNTPSGEPGCSSKGRPAVAGCHYARSGKQPVGGTATPAATGWLAPAVNRSRIEVANDWLAVARDLDRTRPRQRRASLFDWSD